MSAALPSNLVAVTWMFGCSSFHLATMSLTSTMPSESGRR